MKKITKILTAFIIPVMIIPAACSNSNNNNDSSKIPENGIKVKVGSDDKGAKMGALGLNTVNDGLTVKDSYLTVDGKRMENTDVQSGDKMAFVIEGIGGLKEKDGKVFPRFELIVLDETTNMPVLQKEDLLSKSETGYSVAEAAALSGAFTIDNSFKQGSNYKFVINVSDKEGTGVIMSTISLKVK